MAGPLADMELFAKFALVAVNRLAAAPSGAGCRGISEIKRQMFLLAITTLSSESSFAGHRRTAGGVITQAATGSLIRWNCTGTCAL